VLGVDSCFISYLFSHPSRRIVASSVAPEPRQTPHEYEIEIRGAGARDLQDIAEILVDSFFSVGQFWIWTRPLFKLGIYEDLRGRLNSSSPHYRCLVAVQKSIERAASEEAIVATAEIGLKTSPLCGGQIPYISNLAVAADRRRCGIGSRILGECDRLALEWGFDELSLHVLDDNLAARELYFQSGYRLQKIDGWLSAWLLRKPRRLLLHKKIER
jgi:ribosomal protein S18 acetylase RimI-like enzyme